MDAHFPVCLVECNLLTAIIYFDVHVVPSLTSGGTLQADFSVL